MNTGQVISGVAHAGLIGWALLGGLFPAAPPPFEVTQVTAISTDDFNALLAAQQAPEAVAEVNTPEPPKAGQAPELSSAADPAIAQDTPQATQTPEPEAAPAIEPPAPLAPAEVSQEPPALQPPSEDVAVLVPELSARPKPRPAPRVAPEPVAQPEPDIKLDEVAQPETAPDKAAQTPKQQTEATAREQATTEIVTEAERAAQAAPTRSPRPKSRPAQRTAKAPAKAPAKPGSEPAASKSASKAAVRNALAEALAEAGNDTPSGPPLTRGEKDALRVAVQACWNVGSLSSDALRTTVVVAVGMGENGKPEAGSIRMVSASGGSSAAARQAFEAARRAIIRCGARGFHLPPEKYDRWRDIEMTFNPEKMRIK